jgi:hypothetical protein
MVLCRKTGTRGCDRRPAGIWLKWMTNVVVDANSGLLPIKPQRQQMTGRRGV